MIVYQFQRSILLTCEPLLHDKSIDPVRDNHIESRDSVAVEEDNQGRSEMSYRTYLAVALSVSRICEID